jgi:glycopeptide antibiotics resistance protein
MKNQTVTFNAAVEFVGPVFLGGKLVALIVGGIIGVILTIVGIVLGIFLYRRHKKDKKKGWNVYWEDDSIKHDSLEQSPVINNAE